jgi:hypothetical protein
MGYKKMRNSLGFADLALASSLKQQLANGTDKQFLSTGAVAFKLQVLNHPLS